MWASRSARDAAAKELMRFVDTGLVDGKGRTALMWAAGSGAASIVRMLASQGNVAKRDNSGLTALDHATRAGHDDCAKLCRPVFAG